MCSMSGKKKIQNTQTCSDSSQKHPILWIENFTKIREKMSLVKKDWSVIKIKPKSLMDI